MDTNRHGKIRPPTTHQKGPHMRYNEQNILLLHGDPAAATFDRMERLFTDLRPVIESARIYARSSSPILIEAGAGPELDMLAQSIHNESERSKGPYAVLDLSGTTNEEQQYILFGNPRTGQQGMILDCNRGTLLIQGIDKLTLPVQAQFARVLRTRRVMSQTNYSQYRFADVRFIVSTSKNLTELRNHFLFRSDLLFTIRALRLRIPRLRERPHDIENMLDLYLADYNRQYGRHHTLTAEARRMLLTFPWETNIMQLQAFCERMVLTAPAVRLDTTYVDALLRELYAGDSAIYDSAAGGPANGRASVEDTAAAGDIGHTTRTDGSSMAALIPETPESNDIMRDVTAACLRRNKGNRKQTARDLGISTTTLWRRIRYYHLEDL